MNAVIHTIEPGIRLQISEGNQLLKVLLLKDDVSHYFQHQILDPRLGYRPHATGLPAVSCTSRSF